MNNKITKQSYQSINMIIPANPSLNQGAILLGDVNSSKDRKSIKIYKIKTIISCSKQTQHQSFINQPDQIKFYKFPIIDNQKQIILQYMEQIYNIIQENLQRGGILIKCFSGVSRSPALLISYLIKKKKIEYEAALRIVTNKRNWICLNQGFVKQLKDYEKRVNRINQNSIKQQKEEQIQKNQNVNIVQTLQQIKSIKNIQSTCSIKEKNRCLVKGAAKYLKQNQIIPDLIEIKLQKYQQKTQVPTQTENSELKNQNYANIIIKSV